MLILSYNLANEALFNSQQAKSVSQAAETSILFRLNYNKRVRAGQFIEFRGDTYIIVSIDSFEYYKRDLTVRAEKVKPEVYDYEEYTEQ